MKCYGVSVYGMVKGKAKIQSEKKSQVGLKFS
jgi:hypothetical protein